MGDDGHPQDGAARAGRGQAATGGVGPRAGGLVADGDDKGWVEEMKTPSIPFYSDLMKKRQWGESLWAPRRSG